MKRRTFLQNTTLSVAGAALPLSGNAFSSQLPVAEKEYYELRTYTLKFGGNRAALNQYLEETLIPALNRNGVKQVGVFEELSQDNPVKIYVLIPYPSLESFLKMPQQLAADATFAEAKKRYDMLPPEQQVFQRYDTWLLEAFDGIPQMKMPKQGNRIFELRTYEGYSEDAVRRKVKMFNDEELPLFEEVGLHSVFFGNMIAGPAMPALTYMLYFENLEERDKNWDTFINHPEWKRMSALPEYANSVSNIIRVFLKPMSFSQV